MRIEFKEEQRFTQWWLWAILIGTALIPIYRIYNELFLKEQVGVQSIYDLEFIILIVIIFPVILLFLFTRLKTVIDSEKIEISFFPLARKKVMWKDVRRAKIVDYGFLGGWGVRLGTSYGTVYNVKGSKGVAIELRDGGKFLIGTQKEQELSDIIDKIDRSR